MAKEPTSGELLAAALASGSVLDPKGTSRDVIALLARFRVAEAELADEAIAGARQALAGNDPGLRLLEKIDQSSRAADADLLPFGPVHHVDAGAVERLALLTHVGFSSDSLLSLFFGSTAAFVTASGGGLPPVITIASLVQDRLGGFTLAALRWRDEVIPHLLQASFERADLVAAAAGAVLPGEWAEANTFLAPWVNSRPTLRPDANAATDDIGFLTGPRPAAHHPLVLRILRPKVQAMLASPDQEVVDEATSFIAFLATTAIADDAAVAASPTLFPPAATIAAAVAAGALILASARSRGVTLRDDGSIQTSGAAEPWASLTDRVLKTLIFGAESGVQRLPDAWTNKSELKQLLGVCPEWGPAMFGPPLLARAQDRLAASLSTLGGRLKTLAAIVPSPDGATDRFATRPRSGRSSIVEDVNRAAVALKTIQGMSTEAAQARLRFEGHLVSPLGEPTLHRVLPGRTTTKQVVDAADGTIATYLTAQIARLTAPSLVDALGGTGAWAASVNQRATSVADLPTTWVPLELWDGLRGRLIDPVDGGDGDLADTLAQRLPTWLREPATPPTAADMVEGRLDELRPALAAVAHLGLPIGPAPAQPASLSFAALRDRLEGLLDVTSPLTAEARTLIAAAWIELTVSFVAAMASDVTLSQVFGEPDDLRRFTQRGTAALDSAIAWETRAGLNALILVARLADVTGDPQIPLTLDQQLTPRAVELVASTVARVLAGAPADGVARSALPLALVGSDLSRIARESAQALDTAQIRMPRWLASPLLSRVRNQASVLTGELAARFAASSPSPLRAFAWQGGRAGRSLLLAVFQIELNNLFRKLHFVVRPLEADNPDLVRLQRLETAVRAILCTERVLVTGLLQDRAPRSSEPTSQNGALVPWWNLGYWSAPANQDSRRHADPAPADGRTLCLVNWAAAFRDDLDARQLRFGAAVAAVIPTVRNGEAQDVDGLSSFALPDLSFQAALRTMTTATASMKEAERDYARALTEEAGLGVGLETLSMLKKPLRLDIADAAEQERAADAIVRQAEADLDAAKHDSIASEFQAASIEMLYQASEVEVKRQQVLTSISKLEVEVKQLEQDAKDIDIAIASGGVDAANLALKKARIIQQQADKQLQMAADSRSLVVKQIQVLNLLLKNDVVVTLPGGEQRTVPGQIAAMGLKLEISLKKKLTDDEGDARAKLKAAQEEEERRRELERQSAFIKGILSFAGSVVGFVVGGPAGAALGSAIMGAAGDLVNGIVEEKPIEDILVNLAGDALSAAKAAGVNLDGLLAQVGSIAGKDADQLFRNVESSLQPILDNLPRVLDESLLRDAFKDLDLTGVAALNQLVTKTIEDLAAHSPSLGNLTGVLNGIGVRDPIAFGDPDAFRQRLADQILAGLRADPSAREAVRTIVGMSGSAGDTIEEEADRLATLVVTRLGLGASGYTSDVLGKWISAKKKQNASWNQVADEGNALLAQLYPDVRARSEVQANVRMALLDPETSQGQVQSFLTPWQEELDKRIAAVKDAGEEVLRRARQPASPVEAAEARLNFILACEDKFGLKTDRPGPGSLLAFLQGQAPQRLELFDKLLKQQEADERAQNEIDLAKFTVAATAVDVESANAQIKQAQEYLRRAGIFLAAAKLEVREATLQTTVNELAGQHAEDTAVAQQKASESAAENVKAAAARIDAAQATLEARRAQYAGAKLRAAEASRIRESLRQPPLRLPAEDVVAGTIAFARFQHADALDRGLRASRQILRLLRAAQIPESDWPRPDAALGDPQVARTPWSVSLAAQARGFTELFERASAPSVDSDRIRILLGPTQIEALQSAGGLKLRLRPGVDRPIAEGDSIELNIEDAIARSGRVIAVVLAGKVHDRGFPVPITGQHYHPSAEYRGDRWVSPTELHFINVQQLKGSRVSLMDPKLDPLQFVLQQGELRDTQGDPRFNDVQGTPISGTTVLRLVNVNPRPPLPGLPIEGLTLTVLHSFFE